MSAAGLIAPSDLTFTRASLRTNPVNGAEVAVDTPVITTVDEIVPTAVTEVAGSDGYAYKGRLTDGRYVFQGPAGIYTSLDGEPPYTLLAAGQSLSRITARDTFLGFTPNEPADVYRLPAPYTTQTKVTTLLRGFVATNGVSGTNTNAASGMGFASHGDIVIIGEYSNDPAIKESNDPPRYLHRSTDDGLTWTVIEPVEAMPGTHVHSLMYDDVTGNWYCSYGDNAIKTITGVYKSTDEGLTWSHIAGSTVPNEYGVGIQPVSAFRFGNYIIWGTDTVPTGIWIHDPVTDIFTRVSCDYSDYGGTPSITWTGVPYNLAKVGDFLILVVSGNSQESYHKVYATDDLARFWKVIDTEDGWAQPVIRSDGSFLVKPSITNAGNFAKVAGLTLRSHSAIATDEAAESITPSAVPMDETFWVTTAGDYIGNTGPGGLRAYKAGIFSRNWPPASKIVIGAGETIEASVWLRNPLALAPTTGMYFEIQPVNSGGSTIVTTQKGLLAGNIPIRKWARLTYRYTMPANTAALGLRLFMIGTAYDATTDYFEVAGLTFNRTYDADVETHNRAAETASINKAVGATWGVYDRVFPRWDTHYELPGNKTLLTLTDTDTSAYLSVVYNATSEAFEITDGTNTEAGATVRCLGDAAQYRIRFIGYVKKHDGQADFMAYGVRRTSSGVELVVWDKLSREITAVTAPGSFAPSNLRITFPASGVLHVPSFATGELTDAQTFSALQGIMPNADTPGDVGAIDTAPWVTLAEFVDGATVIDGAARVTLAEFADGVTTEDIAPSTALEEWPQ